MYNKNFQPAYCNHMNLINFGWPDKDTFANQILGVTLFLTIFHTGKNSNLKGDMHKDLHN